RRKHRVSSVKAPVLGEFSEVSLDRCRDVFREYVGDVGLADRRRLGFQGGGIDAMLKSLCENRFIETRDQRIMHGGEYTTRS
ncbi:hypothetical protein, partial [Gordonia paraffinivorans]|uniref:hypothetical protein n=1 Tax=Gordonia paraffinivorans TaxID=175628 RepID=UPI00058BF9D0